MKKLIRGLIFASISSIAVASVPNFKITSYTIKSPNMLRIGSYKLAPNGIFYGLFTDGNAKREVELATYDSNGNQKIITKVPHPGIIPPSFIQSSYYSVNNAGNVIVGIPYRNDVDKEKVLLQFYNNATKTWSKLADYFSVVNYDYRRDLYLDDNNNVYVKTDSRMLKLQDGTWSALASYSSKREDIIIKVKNDNIFYLNTNSSSSYNILKYSSDGDSYQNDITLTDNPYKPMCSAPLSNNAVLTAMPYSHEDIESGFLRFDYVPLTKPAVNSGSEQKNISVFSAISALTSVVKSVSSSVSSDSSDASIVSIVPTLNLANIPNAWRNRNGVVNCVSNGIDSYFYIVNDNSFDHEIYIIKLTQQ